MNIVVYDLEQLCWIGKPPKHYHKELIQIGAVLIDHKTMEIIKSNSYIINPTHSKISKYCTELTGITKHTLNKTGTSFQKAIELFQKDFGPKHKICASWGIKDKDVLEKSCLRYNIPCPLSSNYIDIQLISGLCIDNNPNISLKNALTKFNINLSGIHHNAEHDAFNSAMILIEIFKRSKHHTFLNVI